MTRRDLFVEVLRSHLSRPYIWGGDDPTGFDCSGLILEGLKSVGLFPHAADTTADDMMRNVYRANRRLEPAELEPGCLLFWGTAAKATHVEAVYVMIGALPFTIGASGGGARTNSPTEAAAQNAYVKVRPARSGWLAAIDPFSA